MRRLRPFHLALVGAVVAWTPVASAEERGGITTRVRVVAPEGCASETSLWRATSRRTDRLRASEGTDVDVSIDVVIRRGVRGATGELSIVRGGKRSAQRRVRGASCEEVTQGLSLIAALAFDPAARTDLPEEEGSNASDSTSSSDPPPAPAAPVAAAALPPSAPPVAADRPATVQDRGPAARWRFGGGLHGGGLGLASPAAAVAYGAFLDLERDAPGLSPSFRAGVMRADGAASSAGVNAELAWTLAQASFCPVRLDLRPGFSVRPCAGVDLGSMGGRALRLQRSQDSARPWVAPTATARLSWSPARVVFVELAAGLAMPLVRDEVAVDPSVSLYRAPAVVPFAQVGAGMRFP